MFIGPLFQSMEMLHFWRCILTGINISSYDWYKTRTVKELMSAHTSDFRFFLNKTYENYIFSATET